MTIRVQNINEMFNFYNNLSKILFNNQLNIYFIFILQDVGNDTMHRILNLGGALLTTTITNF